MSVNVVLTGIHMTGDKSAIMHPPCHDCLRMDCPLLSAGLPGQRTDLSLILERIDAGFSLYTTAFNLCHRAVQGGLANRPERCLGLT